MVSLLQQFAADTKINPSDIGVPKVDLTENTLANVFSAVLVFIGAMAVLFLLIGAARYVTANGDAKQISQAKNTIIYALVGMVVSALAFVIVQFVLGRITGSLT